MGALRVALAIVALGFASPAKADPVSQWQHEIAEASARFGIPYAWIVRVMRAESGGRTLWRDRPITSPAGALGLMQLMPDTWADLRRTHGLGSDPHDPRDNILAGTAYLRAMYDRFGYPGLFAAYNAGPKRYATHLATGKPLPAETRAYIAEVAGASSGPRIDRTGQALPPQQVLFAIGNARVSGPTVGASLSVRTAKSDPLFAIRAAR